MSTASSLLWQWSQTQGNYMAPEACATNSFSSASSKSIFLLVSPVNKTSYLAIRQGGRHLHGELNVLLAGKRIALLTHVDSEPKVFFANEVQALPVSPARRRKWSGCQPLTTFLGELMDKQQINAECVCSRVCVLLILRGAWVKVQEKRKEGHRQKLFHAVVAPFRVTDLRVVTYIDYLSSESCAGSGSNLWHLR